MIAWATILMVAAVEATAPHKPVVTRPDWLQKPSGDDIAGHYPKLMLNLGIEGTATIKCVVTSAGDIKDCAVVFESPRGLGVGQAAIDMAPSFKLKPQTVDGRPVGGAIVKVPINFTIGDDSPRPSFSSMPHYDSDPQAKKLAEKLASLIQGPNFAAKTHEQIEAMAATLPDEGQADSRRKMIQAYETATDAYEPVLSERTAALCAELFTPKQMKDSIVFLESESGQAFFTNLSAIGPQLTREMAGARPAIAADALKTYCASAPDACPSRPPLHPNGGKIH